jgi:hypothetical protein
MRASMKTRLDRIESAIPKPRPAVVQSASSGAQEMARVIGDN